MKPGIASCVLEQRFSAEEAMRVAADIGYEGYEIDVGPSPHYSIFGGETDLARMRDPHRWRSLHQVAESAGIKICSICLGVLHSFGLGDPDEVLRKQGVSILKEACKAAADIDVRVILVPIPQPNTISVSQAQKNIVQSLRECTDVAQENGVVLAVENMPNTLYGPASQILTVMDQVGSPSCRVYYDLANPEVKQIHAADEIPLLRGLIEQVHIKDLLMPTPDQVSVVSIGEGDVDLTPGMNALREAGYDGFVVVEVPSDASVAFRSAEVNLRGLAALGLVS